MLCTTGGPVRGGSHVSTQPSSKGFYPAWRTNIVPTVSTSGWRWTSAKAHGRRNTPCQRWSKLKFHCSCSSGEREITVFKTLDSPTQISVIMKILEQPRITASLILKTFKGTLILKLEPEVLWLAPPLPSLPKSFRNQNQRLYWKKFKSDNYSTTRIFTIYLNRDRKTTESRSRVRASCANFGRQSPPVRGACSLCSLLRTPILAM